MSAADDLKQLRADAEAAVLRRIVDARDDVAVMRLVELAQAAALLRADHGRGGKVTFQ
jgi:hypothetical protein